MKKAEAVARFVAEILPGVPPNDGPWLDQEWNNYTDALCKAGEITDHQYRNWTHPRITARMWAESREA